MSKSDAPSLFRAEVLETRASQRQGKVLIHQPIGYHVAALLALLLVGVIVAFSYYGTYTKKATVRGLLMPEQGLFRLVAPTGGQITAIHAFEGRSVTAGETLFQLATHQVIQSGRSHGRIVEQLEHRITLTQTAIGTADQRLQRERQLIDERIAAIDVESAQLLNELATLERRERLAENQETRVRRQTEAGFISPAQLEQAQLDRLALTQQRQGMERSRLALERDRVNLLANREDIEARYNALAIENEKSLSALRQELVDFESRNEALSTAPFSGVVTGVHVHPGSIVTPGALLASIVPNGEKLVGHLYASERSSGFLEPGQPVRIRLAAYPHQKYGMFRGRLKDIAQSPYALAELPMHIATTVQHGSTTPGLYYRITVELENQTVTANGQPWALRPGMVFEADVIQETRRLYEWALDPIYAVTGRMGRATDRETALQTMDSEVAR